MTVIPVHTTYATKGESPDGVLMVNASDTDILFITVSMIDPPGDWCNVTAAVNCFWPRSALEMD